MLNLKYVFPLTLAFEDIRKITAALRLVEHCGLADSIHEQCIRIANLGTKTLSYASRQTKQKSSENQKKLYQARYSKRGSKILSPKT